MSSFAHGLDYLYGLRLGLPEPELVSLMLHPRYRQPACTWIGEHIQGLNAQIQMLLEACHACVMPDKRPQVLLFAAPLSPQFQLDGFCALPSSPTLPTRILLDLGGLDSQYWLALLVHEYAHALVATPGHDRQFQRALASLCLALDLELLGHDWQRLPLYPQRPDRLAFWLGESQTLPGS